MTCPDCKLYSQKTVTLIFDAKQMGEVCPSCERVYSVFLPQGGHKHYATERGYKDAMNRDGVLGKHRSESTKALVSRILRPID